jgi:hypothetical protein
MGVYIPEAIFLHRELRYPTAQTHFSERAPAGTTPARRMRNQDQQPCEDSSAGIKATSRLPPPDFWPVQKNILKDAKETLQIGVPRKFSFLLGKKRLAVKKEKILPIDPKEVGKFS